MEIDAGQEGTLRLAFVSRGGVSEDVVCGYFSPGDAFTVLQWGRGLRCVPREMARRTAAQAPAVETGSEGPTPAARLPVIERCTYLGYRWPSYEVAWDGRAALAVTRAVSGTPVVVFAGVLGFSISLERLVGDLQLARAGALGDEPDGEERDPRDPAGGGLVGLREVDEATIVVADPAGEVVVAIRTSMGWTVERQMGLPDCDVVLDSLLQALCEIGSRL